MALTLKNHKPRGLDADTDFYGFYVMASGETRELLKKTHERLSTKYNSPVSNGVLLRDVLKAFDQGYS